MPEPQDPQGARPDPDPETEGRLLPETHETVELEATTALEPRPEAPVAAATPPPPPAPPASTEEDEEDGDEEGMLRMSFLEHLEELRIRIIRALIGVAIAFALTVMFSDQIWNAVRQPAAAALQQLGYEPDLVQLTPVEAFMIIWVKLPVLAALFLAAPWVIYQVWSFIAPGLYKRERRMAAPFILSTAGLFILGGTFAYFVAFRFGLVFLLGIGGKELGVRPMISMTEYVDLFINVILGVSLVFELPVLIFFLTLVRVASPRFLLRHSRYAILLIVIAAAIITPTPDVMNLTIFAAPMVLLYFVGVFASYLLVLSREGKSFPWGKVLFILAVLSAALTAGGYMAMKVYGYHWIWQWPFMVK